MNDVEKLDNVTWYGHCVINVMAAISDLPDEAKLVFCQYLESLSGARNACSRRPKRQAHSPTTVKRHGAGVARFACGLYVRI